VLHADDVVAALYGVHITDSTMDKTEFYSELEELLQMPQGSIRGDLQLNKVSHWDSLALVSFIVLAETKYGVPLKPIQVEKSETVADLIVFIETHQFKRGPAA
jgi:acyl carrier protein